MALFSRTKKSPTTDTRRREPVFSERLPDPAREKTHFRDEAPLRASRESARTDAYPPLRGSSDDEIHQREEYREQRSVEFDQFEKLQHFEQPDPQPAPQPRMVGQTTVGALQMIKDISDSGLQPFEEDYEYSQQLQA